MKPSIPRIPITSRVRPANVVRIPALIAALALAGAPLSAQTLKDVLARMDKSAPLFKSMTADIKRDMHTAVVNDDSMDNGIIKVKRDKGDTRMLIELKGPDAKAVSFDGKIASVYYPKIKTVQEYDAGDKRSIIDDFLLLGFGSSSTELAGKYDVSFVGTENIDGKPTGHLQLLPKTQEVLRRLKRADLWISDALGIPVQQKLFWPGGGDFMVVTYSNIKLNPPASETGSMKLNVPKGVHTEHPQF